MNHTARKLPTASDLLLFAEGVRAEVIEGEIVTTSPARAEHGDGVASLSQWLRSAFQKKSGSGQGGGWWIMVEPPVRYSNYNILCHDLAGWRRETTPEKPQGFPIDRTPDWVCEILSPSTRKRDMNDKREILQQAKVPYYWLVDLDDKTVTVLKWYNDGYLIKQSACSGQTLRLEPFDSIEYKIDVLLGFQDE